VSLLLIFYTIENIIYKKKEKEERKKTCTEWPHLSVIAIAFLY
jgi:hypothetical protein